MHFTHEGAFWHIQVSFDRAPIEVKNILNRLRGHAMKKRQLEEEKMKHARRFLADGMEPLDEVRQEEKASENDT